MNTAPRSTRRAATTSWPPALALCVSAFYFNALACLALWALLPALAGFAPTVIVSGSMGPSIQAGDVVLTSPPTRSADVGDVVSFRDRGAERLVTHRVVGIEPDESYRTRGDANASTDSMLVSPDDVVGLGRAVVPAVGLPLHWARGGEWVPLAAWTLATGVAWACLDRLRRRPPPATWSVPASRPSTAAPAQARGDAAPPPNGGGTAPAPVEAEVVPAARRPLARSGAGTAVVAVLALAVALVPARPAAAAFQATTTNLANTLRASSQFCQPSTTVLTPTADARVVSGSSTNRGTETSLRVRPSSSVERSLLQFALPPSGSCVVTGATLRLYTTTGTTGRYLLAYATAAPFTESTVVYGNQPGTTGGYTWASTVSSGWLAIDVLAQVDAIRAGSAYGLLVRDSSEGSSTSTQTFSSREAVTNLPELVLTTSAAAAPPSAPSGLSASPVSSTRVSLAWTDTSSEETGFTVQRTEAGTGAWTNVGSVAPETTGYTDTGLQPSTAYDYRVRAESAGGVSPWSDVAMATTPAAPTTPPAAPGALTATAGGVERIDLSWTDNAMDSDGFELERSPVGAGTWTAVAAVQTTTYEDTGRTGGTAYDYRVRAVNGAGASEWSPVVTGTTASCSTLPAQTLVSVADSLVLQSDPSTPYGTGSLSVYLGVRSSSSGNARSLVRFGGPTISGGCAVTGATLRAYATSSVAGRTLEALTVAASWTESGVTWSNQPAATGTAVTTTSGTGWRTWDVTSLVGTAGTGAPHGFLLRDSVEGAGTTLDNYLSPREGSYPPQLVVRFD